MRRFLTILFIIGSLAVPRSLLMANGPPLPEGFEVRLLEMFSYAKAKDLGKLEELEDDINRADSRTLSSAYDLALYIAGPDKYRKRFVEHFPEDDEGVSNFFDLELKGLTPRFLFSVESIGEIAAQGDEVAIRKTLVGCLHSGGADTEIFCEGIQKILLRQTGKAVKALSDLPERDRKRIYSACLQDMKFKDYLSLKKKLNQLKPKLSPDEANVTQEILLLDTSGMWRK
jgi:hypothetical protein